MLPWWEARAKNLYIYGISPFSQRAFGGIFDEYKRMAKSGLKNSLLVVPFIAFGYGLIQWAEYDNHKRKRKQIPNYDEITQ